MNREIKFRAWDGEKMMDTFSVQSNGDGINYRGNIMTSWVLMQYTGLKDKNGKEIYQGDIVQFINLLEVEDRGYVKFRDGSFRLSKNLNPSKEWDGEIRQWNDGSHDWYSIENLESFEMELVGNIYESPELLNQSFAKVNN